MDDIKTALGSKGICEILLRMLDDYIEDEYETGMNSISEQEEQNREKADELYDDVYDKVYQQELSKIENSEYILNQMGGYTKPTVSNLFKRTRKLPRVVK
jgi:hypothetical protein